MLGLRPSCGAHRRTYPVLGLRPSCRGGGRTRRERSYHRGAGWPAQEAAMGRFRNLCSVGSPRTSVGLRGTAYSLFRGSGRKSGKGSGRMWRWGFGNLQSSGAFAIRGLRVWLWKRLPKSASWHPAEEARGFWHLFEHLLHNGPYAPSQGAGLGTHARPKSSRDGSGCSANGFGLPDWIRLTGLPAFNLADLYTSWPRWNGAAKALAESRHPVAYPRAGADGIKDDLEAESMGSGSAYATAGPSLQHPDNRLIQAWLLGTGRVYH